MEGKVILSVEEYEKLQDKANQSDGWEFRYNSVCNSYKELEHKYHELLMEKMYNEYSYHIPTICDYGCNRDYLIDKLVKDYNMDSLTKINQVIDELIEMYKEKNKQEGEEDENK